MRIGTNHGSLSDRIMNRYGDTPLGMVESALEFAWIARDLDYHALIFSMKSSNPKVMVHAYRLLVARLNDEGDDWNYPIHLGVTEAGEGEDARIKSAIGIGALLADGIGDTLRVSLTADPVKEVEVAWEILKALGLRERGPVMIACPSCGRDNVGVENLAVEVEGRLKDYPQAFEVAVMGCAVNGPGEARDADIGIAAGKGRGHLFVKGVNVAVMPEDEMVDALVEGAEFIGEHGVEGAQQRAEATSAGQKARRAAASDRAALLGEQGDDANHAEQRVELIRSRAERTS